MRLQPFELELVIEPQRWQQGRVAACRQALAAHGEPLRWAITSVHRTAGTTASTTDAIAVLTLQVEAVLIQ